MKIKNLIIVLVMIMTLLAGCTKNNNLSEKDKEILSQLESGKYKCESVKKEEYKRRNDVISESKPTEIKWEEVELSKVKYWFDSDIDLKKRKTYIEDTVNILSELNNRYSKENTYNIYISDKVISHNEDKKIYIKYNNKFDSSNFIIQVLYNIFGDTSNYGLLYGEMIDIQKTLKIYKEQDFAYDKDYIEKEIAKKREMLDLTLPVFTESYNNSIDIDYMKKLSIDFVNYIKDKHGNNDLITLIKSSSELNLNFDDKFTEYMNEYLKHKKLNISRQKETITYRYKMFNDVEFPICMCTEWMNYCFDPQYKCLYPSTYISNDSMGENPYAKMKEIVAHWDKCMSEVRKYLGNGISVSKKDTKNVFTYITNKSYIKVDVAGRYEPFDNFIYCQDIEKFVHEYTHYITIFDKDMKWFRSEKNIDGIAEICSYKFEDKNVDFINKQYESDLYWLFLNLNIKTQFDSYLKSIGVTSQNENVFKDTDRQLDYIEMIWYKYLTKPKSIDLQSYPDTIQYIYGCAFVRYLIDNYGVDKYMQYFNTNSKNDFYDIYGRNIEKVNNDFIDYLKSKYDRFIH